MITIKKDELTPVTKKGKTINSKIQVHYSGNYCPVEDVKSDKIINKNMMLLQTHHTQSVTSTALKVLVSHL